MGAGQREGVACRESKGLPEERMERQGGHAGRRGERHEGHALRFTAAACSRALPAHGKHRGRQCSHLIGQRRGDEEVAKVLDVDVLRVQPRFRDAIKTFHVAALSRPDLGQRGDNKQTAPTACETLDKMAGPGWGWPQAMRPTGANS